MNLDYLIRLTKEWNDDVGEKVRDILINAEGALSSLKASSACKMYGIANGVTGKWEFSQAESIVRTAKINEWRRS